MSVGVVFWHAGKKRVCHAKNWRILPGVRRILPGAKRALSAPSQFPDINRLLIYSAVKRNSRQRSQYAGIQLSIIYTRSVNFDREQGKTEPCYKALSQLSDSYELRGVVGLRVRTATKGSY